MTGLPVRPLVSFPGRAGDLLWACCAIRSLSETLGTPVDLQICGEFDPLVDLLAQQPYLGLVWADPDWGMSQSVQAPVASRGDRRYDFQADLGYKRWPEFPLPVEVWMDLNAQSPWEIQPLDLQRPWITVEGPGSPCDVAVGFTEAWFELKLGLLASVTNQCHNRTLIQFTPLGTRWRSVETAGLVSVHACGWLDAARAIRNADVVLADCSALHVLAVAIGREVIVVEPMEARLSPIFWPLGMTGPQVYCVMGNDGKPSFDARHTAETLERVLGRVK